MKYGLLVVKDTENIGDDIQAYAARQFLPQVDYYVDREHLDTFVSDDLEPVKVIMNGWYMDNKWNWPPSPVIDPLLISMHFQKEDLMGVNELFLQGLGGEYFKKQAIVGCRDTETQAFLTENGINAEFSGCLTLTLKPEFERKVDKPYCCITNCDTQIANYVKEQRPDLEVKIISQGGVIDQTNTWEQRLNNAKKLLTVYQNAEFVITTRLHCAMPCLALNTPVLFLKEDSIEEIGRFEGLSRLVYCESSEHFIQGSHVFDINNPPENKTDYLKIRESLIKKCKAFIGNEVTSSWKKEDILKQFKENACWKDELLISVRKRNFQNYGDLYAGKQWLEEQWKSQKNRTDELEKWCKELNTGKKWLEEQWENQKTQISDLEQDRDVLQGKLEAEKDTRKALEEQIALLKRSGFVKWLIKKKNLSL